MTFAFVPEDRVSQVRGRLDHPVIDADGHQVEFLPLVRQHVVELAGEPAAVRFDRVVAAGRQIFDVPPGVERRERGMFRTGWWSVPTANTLDRATCMLPPLLHRRLDEMGVDLAVLYPTYGFVGASHPDAELRRVMARAFNRYSAEVFGEFGDRLRPVAVIPMVTPEEAVDEITYAVDTLGLRAVMLAGVVPRRWPGADEASPARWMDTLAHDSPFDYEPVWEACQRRRLACSFHSGGQGWGTRMSTTNYMYNHIGSFAAGAEAAARSLIFGGVPRRYPDLRFAFLEGGVAWAASLYADLLGHWSKRNRETVLHYDPARLDGAQLAELFEQHARGRMRDRRHELPYGLHMLSEPLPDGVSPDEFASTGISGPEDVADIFTRQYFFGCEADDPLNALAFASDLNPHGARLRAIFASDIGHWDVPDVREPLPEAYEMVTDGHLDDGEFRDFVFGNAARLWGASALFEGTVVEEPVRAFLAEAQA